MWVHQMHINGILKIVAVSKIFTARFCRGCEVPLTLAIKQFKIGVADSTYAIDACIHFGLRFRAA